jgi:hypothetical protein
MCILKLCLIEHDSCIVYKKTLSKIVYVICTFTKLWKTTTSFIMSVCLSKCPGATLLSMDRFSLNSILKYFFWKSVQKIKVSLKLGKNNWQFTWRPVYIFYHISLSSSLNEKCFRQIFFNLCSLTFFWKLCNVVKYYRTGQATLMIIWHMDIACWIPKAKNTHSEYTICICFYTVTVVTWMYLNVML